MTTDVDRLAQIRHDLKYSYLDGHKSNIEFLFAKIEELTNNCGLLERELKAEIETRLKYQHENQDLRAKYEGKEPDIERKLRGVQHELSVAKNQCDVLRIEVMQLRNELQLYMRERVIDAPKNRDQKYEPVEVEITPAERFEALEMRLRKTEDRLGALERSLLP